MARARKIRDRIILLLEEGRSFDEIVEELGCSKATISYHNRKHNIREKRKPRPPRVKTFVKLTNEQVFCAESTYPRGHIKRRILLEKMIPYQCQECGLGDEWENKPLTLILDHINGIHNDHRLENLRFLCPNCNSQTETFAGRNRPYKQKN